jgi:hypothetical protein
MLHVPALPATTDPGGEMDAVPLPGADRAVLGAAIPHSARTASKVVNLGVFIPRNVVAIRRLAARSTGRRNPSIPCNSCAPHRSARTARGGSRRSVAIAAGTRGETPAPGCRYPTSRRRNTQSPQAISGSRRKGPRAGPRRPGRGGCAPTPRRRRAARRRLPAGRGEVTQNGVRSERCGSGPPRRRPLSLPIGRPGRVSGSLPERRDGRESPAPP